MSDSKTRHERGLDVMQTLAGSKDAGGALAEHLERQGALGSFALNTGAGEIWSRPGLSRRDRSLVVISFLTAFGRELELPTHIAGGLNHGLSREEIDEIMVQISAYAGVPFALAGAGIAEQVFAQQDGTEGRTTPPAPAPQKDPEKRRAAGLDVLRTLLGQPDLDTQGTEAAIIGQLGDMCQLVLDFAFGDVWSRPQLSRRDRSLVVISVLTALSQERELATHLQGALNHGVSQEEIEEVMIMMILYGGFPRAINGLQCARKVFAGASSAP